MFGIGFNQNDYAFYEGEIGFGRAIAPSPVLSVATFISTPTDIAAIPESTTRLNKFVFREDSFDPVTRIRRGRIYKWADGYAQPHRWRVQPYPGSHDEQQLARFQGPLTKDLFSWAAWPAFQQLGRRTSVLLALGSRDAYTLWRVVDVERVVTGEDLITLRAHNSLGILPALNASAIPMDGREKVLQTIEKLANAAYTTSEPEAVIDLARAAAQWCLGTWLADKRGRSDFKGKDLGHLISELEHREKDIAMLIARFHSRAKPNEAHNFQSRPVTDEDAEFCLAGIALLLRELGWAT
jgi:hypothetical protein